MIIHCEQAIKTAVEGLQKEYKTYLEERHRQTTNHVREAVSKAKADTYAEMLISIGYTEEQVNRVKTAVKERMNDGKNN